MSHSDYLSNHNPVTQMHERGSALVGALILLLALGYIGTSVLSLTSSDAVSSVDNLQSVQALQVGNGGLQYALQKVDSGLSPVVTDKELAGGTFSVAVVGDNGVQVTSKVGRASKTQTINANFANFCVSLDTTQAYSTGKTLDGIRLLKTCNTKAILDKVTLSWNFSQCALNLSCSSSSSDNNSDDEHGNGHGNDKSNKVYICHVPPGKPSNAHTIYVGEPSLSAHLAHGDALGVCAGDTAVQNNCDATIDNLSPSLNQCSIADNSAKILQIQFANQTIYNSNTGTVSGQEIDVDDTMMANQYYDFNAITFDSSLPDGGWYTITTTFADGSALTNTFKAGTLVVAAGSSSTSGTSNGNSNNSNGNSNNSSSGDSTGSSGNTSSSDDSACSNSGSDSNSNSNSSSSNGNSSNSNGNSSSSTSNSSASSGSSSSSSSSNSGSSSAIVDATPGYESSDGKVDVDKNYVLTAKVLGSAITCGSNGPSIDVVVDLGTNNKYSGLYKGKAVTGDETYTAPTTVASVTSYTVRANASLKRCNNFNATIASINTTQVKTLINGQQAPALAGFGGQKPVQSFLKNYLSSSGKVVLKSNQVIMLFEIGTTDMSSSAADFQDLVMLLTITKAN